MEILEQMSLQIISSVGAARSNFIMAIDEASDGNFTMAKQLLDEGKQNFHEGHMAHASLLSESSKYNNVQINLLIVHAEDQLMSAETFGILAERFIKIYKRFENISDKS